MEHRQTGLAVRRQRQGNAIRQGLNPAAATLIEPAHGNLRQGAGAGFVKNLDPGHPLQEKTTFNAGGRQLWDTYLGTGGYLTDNFGLQLDINTLSGEYGREHSDTDVQNYRLRGQWNIDDDRDLSFGIQHTQRTCARRLAT